MSKAKHALARVLSLGAALALGLTAAMAWAPDARAQTLCAASLKPRPDKGQNPPGDVLEVGETVTFDLAVENECQTNGTFVPAELRGTTTLELTCGNLSFPCNQQLLNVLQVTNCVGTSDVVCTVASNAPGAAVIELTYTGSCDLNTAQCGSGSMCKDLAAEIETSLATVTAVAVESVPNPTGQFFVIGTIGFGEICSDAAAGSGQGSAPLYFPPTCDVEIDKSVTVATPKDLDDTCDEPPLGTPGPGTCRNGGGSCVTDDDCRVIETAFGWNGEPAGYVIDVRNDGDQDLSNCVVTDARLGLEVPVGNLSPGQTLQEPVTAEVVCSDLSEGQNTASVSCDCTVPELGPVTDADTADLECLSPSLEVSKVCVDSDGNNADDAVEVTAINTGDANLVNCVLTDVLDTAEPAPICPGDGVDLEDVAVAPSLFELAAGTDVVASGDFGDRLSASCNTAEVVCQIDDEEGGVVIDPATGQPKTIGDDDDAPCQPLECDVRLDKKISTDGGETFADAGDIDVRVLGKAIGWGAFDGNPAEPVIFEFYVENRGTAAAQCDLVDTTNGGEVIIESNIVIQPGQNTVVTRQDTCRAEIEGVDTAQLRCACTDDVGGTVESRDEDSAELECRVPGLAVEKLCVDSDENELADSVSIAVTNTGTAELVDCQATDRLDLNEDQKDEMACAQRVEGPFQEVAVGPQPFDLAMGGGASLSGTFTELAEDACNLVEVTCSVAGTDKSITASDDAPCAGGFCEVAFDKQVSCGAGFVDIRDVDDPGNAATRGCVSWNTYDSDGDGINDSGPEPADKRFVIENLGTVTIRCDLVDELDGVVTPIVQNLEVQPGETLPIDVGASCSPEVSGEDTATLSCECLDSTGGVTEILPDQVDSAEIVCQTAALEVTKICEEQVEGTNNITISITNPASADGATLENCVVTDAQAPGPAPGCEQPVTSPLVPGQTDTINCRIDGLQANVLNQVVVTCSISDSGGKTITRMDQDECEVPGGCLTRTPGFWGTHPEVTELFLPLNSCGIAIDNVEAATSGSAIEDICRSGRDFKMNDTSPQQLQLIRQCTAAALNFAASVAGEGSCDAVNLDRCYDGYCYFGGQACLDHSECVITAARAFDDCCDVESLCTLGASGSSISASGCIELIDAFNNGRDTLECPDAPYPFCPGLGENGFNANPETCREANGNGYVNPGRNLGPRR